MVMVLLMTRRLLDEMDGWMMMRMMIAAVALVMMMAAGFGRIHDLNSEIRGKPQKPPASPDTFQDKLERAIYHGSTQRTGAGKEIL